MNGFVSAIITTCRRPPFFVTRALTSVMSQTYPYIEIIVVDDSPADYPKKEEVRQAVLSVCPSAIFISYGENRGAPAARNEGVRTASGEYIAFLDDDDEWLPEKIEEELRGFVNERVALVYGNHYRSYDKEHFRVVQEQEMPSGMVYEQLLERCFIGSTSIPLIRRSCLEEIGGFDEEMRSGQDYDLYLRLAKKYEVFYIPKILVVYHVHGGPRISTTAQDKILGHERLIRKYECDLKQHPRAWASQHRTLIAAYRRYGDRRRALRTWLATVKRVPFDFLCNGKFLMLALFTPEFPLYRLYHHLHLLVRQRKTI